MAAFTGADGSLGADAPSGVALADRPAPGLEDRIRMAALRCVARGGLRKMTLDDVASEARCSRATIYRAFPGGKDVLMASAAAAEIDRVLEALGSELAVQSTIADTIVVAMTGTTRSVLGHPALQYLWVNEPGVIEPHLSFDGIDPVLARSVDFLAPYLERFVDAVTARRTAEWAARLVVLYADATCFDLTDPADARHLVDVHVLPGLPAATH